MWPQKLEVRSNIKFLTRLGWKKKSIDDALVQVYGDSAPKPATLKKWIKRFKEGREEIEDDERSGRPLTATDDEHVAAVQALIEEDRRLSVEEVARSVGISVYSVDQILTQHLGLSKLSARWVPKALRDEHKVSRADLAWHFLDVFDSNPEDFFARIVTGDETWIYQYDPESKEQSKQWLSRGGPGPIKFKGERSAKKVMATVFWDAEGVILVDFLHDQRTITAQYYESVLRRLHNAIVKKRPGKSHRRILFHHDNASAHTSKVARAVLREFRWELLPHPPYSPDLAPCDFFLFPNLKNHIKGIHWESISDAEHAVKTWFGKQGADFYRNGLAGWRHRMEKCIELDGDYVEK